MTAIAELARGIHSAAGHHLRFGCGMNSALRWQGQVAPNPRRVLAFQFHGRNDFVKLPWLKSKKKRSPSPVLSKLGAVSIRETGDRAKAGRRKWFFRLAALALPLLFLLALEVALRLIGYGYPIRFFLKSQVAGRQVFIENREFSRR